MCRYVLGIGEDAPQEPRSPPPPKKLRIVAQGAAVAGPKIARGIPTTVPHQVRAYQMQANLSHAWFLSYGLSGNSDLDQTHPGGEGSSGLLYGGAWAGRLAPGQTWQQQQQTAQSRRK